MNLLRKLDAEASGAYFGITGALILALALPVSKWGWVLFLGSNVSWLVFSIQYRYRKLLWQTVAFTASSLLGILNAFWPHNAVQLAITSLFA